LQQRLPKKGGENASLETQSCDVLAVDFCLKLGFKLIGFNSTAYSNEDIKKREVRMDLCLTL
jgi:hypothetical protein